ncbi:hypothetical protein HOD30_01545 [Candidatus Peregrinibacteria bacterium]|jgi:hypothetical protein|nr:hypothetical protein [Candidatus Peregrinibacteria bacterium]MBT4632212.1 hypothetical protein [Candidatus Peregrinibacteria bacterium]MBT5516313.1 hypothetical protein [Candidatus Peregrinibacteria bacterium]MBT5824377.1 hypothetical protein [Candidatus Peregrinibacteria bacterium]
MNNGEISVTQALNQIQSWVNAGKYDEAIQGTREILEIEPGNQRALALMKQAEERRQSTPAPEPTPTPEPSMPEPPMPSPEAPELDPLQEFEAEIEDFKPHEKRKLLLAMLIPAILVVLIGGGIIWALSQKQREEKIEDNINPIEELDTSYLERNEERVQTLTNMSAVIQDFKVENGAYPGVKQVESALKDKLSEDPLHGSLDKSGELYGYIYAIYDTSEGDNTAFILSALFEDSKGFGSPWARGANTKNHPDFRDINLEHTILLGTEIEIPEIDESEIETKADGPKSKPKQ